MTPALQTQVAPSPVSFDDVFQAHAETVARWAARLGGPSADVEDIVQDVFVVVERKLAGLKSRQALRSWLYRITANVVRTHRRRVRWRRWWLGSDEDVAETVVSSYPTPVEALQRAEAVQRLYKVLDMLSAKDRNLLILFELEGLSGEEIAELTQTRVSTVWVQLHRARARFIDRLQRFEKKEWP